MDDLIEDFTAYLRYERNYSERTITPYQSSLEEFSRYWKSQDRSLTWQTVTTDIIRDWIVAEMDRGLKAAGICPKLSAVKSFYRYLLRREIVTVDPAHLVKAPRKDKPLPHFVSEKDMDRLLDTIQFPDTFQGRRNHLIIQMLYTTGIRSAELLSMDIPHVDLVQCQITVTGKRNKQRIIPFGQELKTSLQAYLEERQHLSVTNAPECLLPNSRLNGRLTYQALWTLVREALGNVTMRSKRSPHVLRHSFATSMLNNNADLETVKQLLGHESLSTTAIYTHTSFAQLRTMYNQAHPRAESGKQKAESGKHKGEPIKKGGETL